MKESKIKLDDNDEFCYRLSTRSEARLAREEFLNFDKPAVQAGLRTCCRELALEQPSDEYDKANEGKSNEQR